MGLRAAFHATPNQVSDLRLVQIEGSQKLSVLWEETDDRGLTSSHYAISLDGQTFVSVRETSYEIMMRRDRFDPLDRAPQFRNSVTGPASDVYFVQFVTQVLEEYTDAVESLGGSVYGFVSNHTHLVRMDAATSQAVQALALRALGRGLSPRVPLGRRDSGRARHGRPARGQVQRDGLRTRTGSKSPRGSEDHLDRRHARSEVLPEGFLFEATLSAEELVTVAGFAEVQWIDRWSAPENDMNIARNFGGANYVETMAGFRR